MVIYTDGASRGNPGPAGAGIYVVDGMKTRTKNQYLGIATNNQAEYAALLMALRYALRKKAHNLNLTIFSDSKLMVMQVNGMWAIKDPTLKIVWDEVIQLLIKINARYPFSVVKHIPREQNKQADAAANKAIDDHQTIKRHF